MNKVYLTKLEDVLRQARLPTAARPIEFKSCFGAVAGYVRGHIFVSCGRFGVALKLPPETLERLFQEGGCKTLEIFSKWSHQKGVRRAIEKDFEQSTHVQ